MTRQRRILMMAFVALLPLLISSAQGQDDGIGANKIEGYAFDRGDEFWRSEGGANLSWMERGGNPGGFLLGEDADENKTWYYVSPESWPGNWTARVGDVLSFDIRLINDENCINLDFSDILKIYGANSSIITWPGPTVPWPGEPEKGVWTHYEIALVPESFGVNESKFLETMEHVDKILIRGEYSDGRDLEGLDNMILTPPQLNISNRSVSSSHGHKHGRIESETAIESAAGLGPFHRRIRSVTSGVSNEGGSGDGSSSSKIEGEHILLYCEDTGLGDHWASGAVWDEFIYDREDHLCRAVLKCHVKGGIATVGVPDIGDLFGMDLFKSSADLKVYMVLEDMTEEFVVDKMLIYSAVFKDKAFLDEYIDEWPTGEIEAELMNGHVYRLKLDARASSSTVGLSSLIVGFWGSDPEEHIMWSYSAVNWI